MTLQRTDLETDQGILVRLHTLAGEEPLPALVYFHGGGWTSGSVAASDGLCRALAEGGRCAVASVDYRLAPEHPFPAAVDDCFGATAWLADHASRLGLDANRFAVGGTSAGANLAAAVTLLARDRSGPMLRFQLLVYPPLDYGATADVDGASFRRANIDRLWALYLREAADGDDPLASPLRASDLGGLPAALVITAELDPLTDEGEAYAARLVDAGVDAEVRRFAGAEHGFFSSQTPAGGEARRVAAEALRGAFGRVT